MNYNIALELWNDAQFQYQFLLWIKAGGVAFGFSFALIFLWDIFSSIIGRNSLKDVLNIDESLLPAEIYSESIKRVSRSALSQKVVEKWIDTQAQMSAIQRSDFTDHVRRYIPGSYIYAPSIARYFLLGGLFFTFVALSHTFVDFRTSTTIDLTSFVQEKLIPDVGLALTSTLVAIMYSMLTILVGTQVEKLVGSYRILLEEFIITKVSAQHPTANPVENTKHLVTIHQDLSKLVIKTIEELKNVSSITTSAYSGLSDATHKFVTAFDSTQKVIQHVEKNQEQIVNQNQLILSAATALKDSVIGIERVFELENSALREVKESIIGSHKSITDNSKQLSEITIKFGTYNSELQLALGTSEAVMKNVNGSVDRLSQSHEHNSSQVSQYVEILTNSMTSVDATLNGIKSLIDDANKIESNISNEVEKINEASNEFKTIKADAADINTTSDNLKKVAINISDSAQTTVESIESFQGEVKSVKNLVNQYSDIKPSLEKFSEASSTINDISHDIHATQKNIQGHARDLGNVSVKFRTTYDKYINRLEKIEHRPSFWSRIKGIFGR
jgi:archaellum component FlaC